MRRRGVIRVPLENRWAVRVWFVCSLAVAVAGAYVLVDALRASSVHGPVIASGVAATTIGGFIAYLTGRASLAGGRYLLVDVPAGGVELVEHGRVTACSFEELGALEVVEEKRAYRGHRYSAVWYAVRARGFGEHALSRSPYRERENAFRDRLQQQLDALRVRAAVRRLLADAATDGEAFRAAPQLADAVRSAVPDDASLRVAIAALARDPDAEIRVRAGELARTLG